MISAITSCYIFTHADLKQGPINKREYVTFVFMEPGYLTQCNVFQSHSFTCKSYDFIFLRIEFSCVYVPHFHYPFIS